MNDNSWLTLVALRTAALPPIDRVLADVERALPTAGPVTELRTTDNLATCRWGDAVVGITLVPRPIPKPLWEGPAASAWYWPGAAEALSRHEAHLLINFVDESRDLVEKALRLTVLTSAAAAAAQDALAVVWAPGGLVHDPNAFADQARQSDRTSLPLYLWIDFRVRRHEDGTCDVFTTGLARFGKREIELAAVVAPPQQVLEWAYNLAHFLLDRVPVIKDGDTLGLPDGTQFTVQHATSAIDGQTPVLSLTRIEEKG